MDTVSAKQRSRNMALVKNKNTAPEIVVRSLLHRNGYRFRLHRRDLPGTPDIVLPGRCTVIFVHGCFWHGHHCLRGALPTSNRPFWRAKVSRNQERDASALAALRASGWRALTLWQCEIRNESLVLKRLTKYLESGRRRKKGC